jgi:hypothetical protein
MKLKELIMKEMIKSGIEETVSVRVTLNGGESLIIANDSDPVLEQEVGEGTETKVLFSASARAGLSDGIIARQRRDRLMLEPESLAELMKNSENDLFEG